MSTNRNTLKTHPKRYVMKMCVCTCLHKVALLHPSIHFWCNERGTTGSDKERRNSRRVAATEHGPPTNNKITKIVIWA